MYWKLAIQNIRRNLHLPCRSHIHLQFQNIHNGLTLNKTCSFCTTGRFFRRQDKLRFGKQENEGLILFHTSNTCNYFIHLTKCFQ